MRKQILIMAAAVRAFQETVSQEHVQEVVSTLYRLADVGADSAAEEVVVRLRAARNAALDNERLLLAELKSLPGGTDAYEVFSIYAEKGRSSYTAAWYHLGAEAVAYSAEGGNFGVEEFGAVLPLFSETMAAQIDCWGPPVSPGSGIYHPSVLPWYLYIRLAPGGTSVLDRAQRYYDELLCGIIREIIRSPFCEPSNVAAWRTPHVLNIAESIYQNDAYERLDELSDELQEACCEDAEVLTHCVPGDVHLRGCWVVDALLGRG